MPHATCCMLHATRLCLHDCDSSASTPTCEDIHGNVEKIPWIECESHDNTQHNNTQHNNNSNNKHNTKHYKKQASKQKNKHNTHGVRSSTHLDGCSSLSLS